jgi:hypothetical protein
MTGFGSPRRFDVGLLAIVVIAAGGRDSPGGIHTHFDDELGIVLCRPHDRI